MRQKTKTTPLQRGRASSPTGNGRGREREMEDGEKRSKGAETRTVGRTRLKEGGREQGGGCHTPSENGVCQVCVSDRVRVKKKKKKIWPEDEAVRQAYMSD